MHYLLQQLLALLSPSRRTDLSTKRVCLAPSPSPTCAARAASSSKPVAAGGAAVSRFNCRHWVFSAQYAVVPYMGYWLCRLVKSLLLFQTTA
eukprot:1136219-Pelagomonas_calceolata.AAC.5